MGGDQFVSEVRNGEKYGVWRSAASRPAGNQSCRDSVMRAISRMVSKAMDLYYMDYLESNWRFLSPNFAMVERRPFIKRGS